MNKLRLASEENVAAGERQVSAEVNARLNLQSQRMDELNESVQKAQKVTVDNAELLQNLIVGMENLGENFKKLRKDMEGWENHISRLKIKKKGYIMRQLQNHCKKSPFLFQSLQGKIL